MGNDTAITIAGSQGNFELNVYKPVMIYNLIQSMYLIADACISFTNHCVVGIEPNKEKIDAYLHDSLMLVTALNQVIGYDKASKIAKKAYKDNSTLRDACVALEFLTADEFDKAVVPEKMAKPF